ncbi:PAS domain-containing protein [Aquella oligotrophica]|uniref:PAS domain-containing protein n=1 Tax=Aquella oligotrophica TaxID=2067065 RepID=A0A2I7N4W0_9NEIS|nr:PAS domain-containing protein [Aquella oligotrophica]AUR51245.1 hypothetical protein CUN60_02670 [Aquella oligotrophica]
MLELFIDRLASLANMLPTQIIGVKDLDSRYLYCSPNFASLLGYSVEEIVGKHDMFIGEENNASRICEDKQIIQERRALPFIHIDKIKGKLTPLTFIKSPIIEEKTDSVIGILCQVFEFATLDPAQQIINMYQNLNLTQKQNQQLPNLSKREKQIVFLFLANLNSAEMVEIIYQMEGKKISKGTIDCVFTDQLFHKFGVYNRQALYVKLVELGYNRLIPTEMLPSTTIALDTHDLY